MKRILFFIMFFTVAISTRAQVTLDECRHAAQENYPLVRQYNLIQLAEQYNLSNASKGNLPQINISGKASYQSDATTFPIDIPGIGIKGLPKDQYQALIEVQQNIWDGGQIHHQKKEIKAVSQENKYQLDVSMYALNEQVNHVFFGILLLNEQLHQNALLHDNLQRNLKNIEAYRNNGIANDADVDAVKVEILNTKQQRIQLSENPCSWTAHIVHHPHAGSCPADLGDGTDDTYHYFIRNHFPIESMPAILQWISCAISARWYVSLVRQLMIEGVPLSYVWKEVCVLLFMAVILIGITSKIFKNRLE